MKAFLSMCLLSVLVSSGVSNLKCYWVFFDGMGVPRVCNNEQDSCVSNFTAYDLDDDDDDYDYAADDDTKLRSLWGCTTSCTPGDYSFTTLKDNFFRRRVHCCQDNYCNNQTALERYPPHNGLVCPGCSSSSFEDCQDSETVRCRGEENLCIEFVMPNYGLNHSDKVFKGCATQDFCTLARTSRIGDNFFDKINQAQCCHTAAPPKQSNNDE